MNVDNPTVLCLKCSSCGAAIHPEKGVDMFVCPYCGSTFHIGIKWDTSTRNEETHADHIEPSIFQNKGEIAGKRTKKTAWIVLGLFVIILIICELLPTKSKNSPTKVLISPPTMLEKLPEFGETNTWYAFDGWELFVSPELDVQSGNIGVQIHLTNWSSETLLLRYQPDTFVLYLEDGTVFPQKSKDCQPGDLYQSRQIEVKSGDTLELSSANYWCNNDKRLPMFSGTIPVNAEHLYLKLSELGVFSNFVIIFDL